MVCRSSSDGQHETPIDTAGLRATYRLVNHEGALLATYLRAPGSDSGYGYMLKGDHGPGNRSATTSIERIDYVGPDSDKVDYAETVADYKDGAWVKQ